MLTKKIAAILLFIVAVGSLSFIAPVNAPNRRAFSFRRSQPEKCSRAVPEVL